MIDQLANKVIEGYYRWARSRSRNSELRGPDAKWIEEHTFNFGGLRVPLRFTEHDILISGGKGSGKTTALIALMLSRIQGKIERGEKFVVHCFTTKNDDFFPLMTQVFGPQGVSIRNTNPYREDSWAWDLATDLRHLPEIEHYSTTMIKDDQKDQNPFFKKSAQLITRGIIQSLASTQGQTWRPKHVPAILSDEQLCKRVLERCDETRHLASLLSKDMGTTGANIRATLLSEIKSIQIIMSLIEETPDSRRFSLKDAANESKVIYCWETDPRYASTIDPWNGLCLELIINELLVRGKSEVEAMIFFDEFVQLNGRMKMPSLVRMLELARSSNVRSVLATQSPSQVVATYGEHDGEALLGQIHSFMCFLHSDNFGKAYFAKRFSKEKGFELHHSNAEQLGFQSTTGQSPSRSYSRSNTHTTTLNRFDLDRVPEEAIGGLPIGTYEFGMYGKASLPLSMRIDPKTKAPQHIRWNFALTPEWIKSHIPKLEPFEPYEKTLRDNSSFAIKRLEDWESALLGLTDPYTNVATTTGMDDPELATTEDQGEHKVKDTGFFSQQITT